MPRRQRAATSARGLDGVSPHIANADEYGSGTSKPAPQPPRRTRPCASPAAEEGGPHPAAEEGGPHPAPEEHLHEKLRTMDEGSMEGGGIGRRGWRPEREGREKDGTVKREHGVGRESRHTQYINRRAACGSSDSLVVKMRCCKRKAHKRGVQIDKEGMIEWGVKSVPGSLRAIPSTIALQVTSRRRAGEGCNGEDGREKREYMYAPQKPTTWRDAEVVDSRGCVSKSHVHKHNFGPPHSSRNCHRLILENSVKLLDSTSLNCFPAALYCRGHTERISAQAQITRSPTEFHRTGKPLVYGTGSSSILWTCPPCNYEYRGIKETAATKHHGHPFPPGLFNPRKPPPSKIKRYPRTPAICPTDSGHEVMA
ncbi:hypothetical protein B0H13DRAFT_2440799 [Mycena leptocephala]|nr:hypothetical protein B0H13DRAFT_2440799 [Mycena leptocephala]